MSARRAAASILLVIAGLCIGGPAATAAAPAAQIATSDNHSPVAAGPTSPFVPSATPTPAPRAKEAADRKMPAGLRAAIIVMMVSVFICGIIGAIVGD